jgi:hypothetical protein
LAAAGFQDAQDGHRDRHRGRLVALADQVQHSVATESAIYARLEPDLLKALATEEDEMESMLQLLRLSDAHDADDLSRLADPMTRWLTGIDMRPPEDDTP